MHLNFYQLSAMETAVFPKERGFEYCALALAGEAGEVANKAKKVIRGDRTIEEARAGIAKEIGGVLWYCAALASTLGLTLDEIARENLNVLESRAARGVIKGDGDNR